MDDSDEPSLQFDVIDTGLGMSEEQKATLFQPFMQADTSTTRKFGGTGLGLTISKRFAELLGGNITVAATKLGVGTTFRASPCAPSEHAAGSLRQVHAHVFPGHDGSVPHLAGFDLDAAHKFVFMVGVVVEDGERLGVGRPA